MRFDEIWEGPEQLEQLAGLAASTFSVFGAAIEIGAWQGLTAVSIAKAIEPDVLHVVDHWLGGSSILNTDLGRELVKRDNYGIFLANMAEGTAGNFKVWKMDWHEFVQQWKRPIRFLHLDAGHETDEVRDNLLALVPHAVPGAIFAGDDWDWPTVREGVLQAFPGGVQTGAGKLWWVQL